MSRIAVAAVIPARMASSRFPGKPLLQVRGLPMIEHVRRRALLCKRFCEVVVATCDAAIADVVERCGGRCIMTSPEHPAATDRVCEAMRQIPCTHVVNVQGDELLVLPRDLAALVQAIENNPEIPAWNALAPIEAVSELSDSSVVKCVVSRSDQIMYCGRDMSHLASAGWGPSGPIRWILGILGYRRDLLERYGELERTPIETAEAIDQMRIIEHDVLLQGVVFSKGYPGINAPRDVVVVEHYLDEDPAQQATLQEVLHSCAATPST